MKPIIKTILICLCILATFFLADSMQITTAESAVLDNVYLPLLLKNYPPPVPKPGYWRGLGGPADNYDDVEFFVTVDSAMVYEFMLHFAEPLDEPECGYSGTGFGGEVPIISGSFYFETSGYGSIVKGYFDSESMAHGELEVICSEDKRLGPWQWEAVWVNDNQG